MNKNNELITKNSKWFRGFEILPLITTIVIALAAIALGIVEGAINKVAQYYGYGRYRYYDYVFNVGLMFLVWLIGAVTAAINYCVLKVVCSYHILNISYLRKLSESSGSGYAREWVAEQTQQGSEQKGQNFDAETWANNDVESGDDSGVVTVVHEKFGEGKIVKLNKENERIDVEFSDGVKTFVYPGCFTQGYLTLKKGNFATLEEKSARKEQGDNKEKDKNLTRFLLTFFLGWIGSIIINHTELKPKGYTCRTLAYIFLTMVTCGIYALVASISNLSFDPSKESNIGYIKD